MTLLHWSDGNLCLQSSTRWSLAIPFELYLRESNILMSGIVSAWSKSMDSKNIIIYYCFKIRNLVTSVYFTPNMHMYILCICIMYVMYLYLQLFHFRGMIKLIISLWKNSWVPWKDKIKWHYIMSTPGVYNLLRGGVQTTQQNTQ